MADGDGDTMRMNRIPRVWIGAGTLFGVSILATCATAVDPVGPGAGGAGAGSATTSVGFGGSVTSSDSSSSSSTGGGATTTTTSGSGGSSGMGGATTSTSSTSSASSAASTTSSAASTTSSATTTSSGGTGPCSPAIDFTSQTGNFNTMGAVCYRTNATISGWGCSNFDGRTVAVEGTTVTCGQTPLPAPYTDGYTYFAVSAGTYSYASLYVF
jgi:hypothetical protein